MGVSESVRASVSELVRVCVRACVRACVCVRERERGGGERVREGELESVCAFVRAHLERMCARTCVQREGKANDA